MSSEPVPVSVNRQAPRKGLGSRVLGRFHLAGAFWLQASITASRFPGWFQAIGIHAFAGIAWLCLPSVRRTLAHNAELARGQRLGWWDRQCSARRSLVTFAWCLQERNESLRAERWKRFTHVTEGLENWESSGAATGAAVLLTAHIGGWEVGSVRPVAEEGRRIHVVRETEATAELQDTFQRALDARGEASYVTHFATGNADLGLELISALRDGDLVALQGDRPRAGGGVVEVSLFGEPYDLPEGPFVLARMTGAAILPVFNIRTGRRSYRTLLHPPIRVPRSVDRDADHAAAAQSFANEMMSVLREAPEQWFRLGEG